MVQEWSPKWSYQCCTSNYHNPRPRPHHVKDHGVTDAHATVACAAKEEEEVHLVV